MNKLSTYLSVCFLLIKAGLFSQTTQYNQFWNELAVVEALSDKFGGEIDISNAFSDTPDNSNIFSTHTQLSITGALHYYHKAKLNFSLLASYYSNSYVPELGQKEHPEFRFTLQNIYFLKKIGYIAQCRSRLEYRLIENDKSNLESAYRFRERFRFTKPLGRKYIRENTFYIIASDEVFLKIPVGSANSQIFDRNDITGGLGYAFTNNFTIDLLYTLQYAPRKDGDEMINALQVNLRINNPFSRVKNHVIKPKEQKP